MELINATSQKWIDAYVGTPKSAAIIHADGDEQLADEVLAHIKNKLTEKTSPLLLVEPKDNKKSIGVEEIRELHKSLSLQANATHTKQKIARIAAIKQAELLTSEAQNALLKLIEELPKRTLVILLSNDTTRLLSTVTSRCVALPLHPLAEQQALEWARNQGHDESKARKAYMLSEEKSGVFRAYLMDAKSIDESVDIAKDFLSSTVFERQKILKSLFDKKNDISAFMKSLELVAKTGMRRGKDLSSKQKWKQILKEILRTQELLQKNVPAKTALLSLSVSI